MENYLNLYPNIRRVREECNCTQAELASHLNIPQQAISRYETGITKAPLNYLIGLADYCGVSIDYILGRTESGNSITSDEMDLLYTYRELDDDRKIELKEYGEKMRDVQRFLTKLNPKHL